MSNVYIISDPHIGHNGIHNKFRTEFSSEEEHDKHMIMSWNSVVKRRDVVKVLGDFIITQRALPYLHELNGQIHWILGNHDVKITRDILEEYKNISYVGGVMAYKGAVLSHVPIHPQELVYRSWNFNIHGHVHNPDNNPDIKDNPMYYNANVDVMGYTPKLFKEIMAAREVHGKEGT